MTALILNMIVRNESARIARCLRSVLPHVRGVCILDTGSTDDTRQIIAGMALEANLPCHLPEAPFVNFSQARNQALADGRDFILRDRKDEAASRLGSGPFYFLLCDADMELVVTDPQWAGDLTGAAYMMTQQNSKVTYRNTRLVRADVPATYIAPTHEYLSVEGVEPLDGAYFIDHEDGANRPGKVERDINLLTAYLAEHPGDGRTLYYLGQSYEELRMPGLAAATFDRRVTAGGWDEEVWSAQMRAGRCHIAAGDENTGIARLLAAYAMRPSRAEPLYTLAHLYRHKPASQATALLFAEAGLALPKPPDSLFVENEVYDWALRQERSISGFYARDPVAKERAFRDCDWLSKSRVPPAWVRQEARNNLRWYALSLEETFPRVIRIRIDFPNPDGWWAMNASLLRDDRGLWLLQRVCNFKVDKVTGAYSMPDGITRTRNFLCRLDEHTLIIKEMTELRIDPEPDVRFPWVLGFEDMRLFTDAQERLYVSATTRQLTENGLCEIVAGRIDGDRVVDWLVISRREENRNEKNWQPIIGTFGFWLYLHDPMQVRGLDGERHVNPSPLALDHFRGSSQVIPFGDGQLEVEHEVVEAWGPRKYLHRLVYLEDGKVSRMTLPFHFAPLAQNGNQFNCGLVYRKEFDDLMMTYSLNDEESWVAVIRAGDVRGALEA